MQVISDLDEVTALLSANHLPTDDVADPAICFLGVRDGDVLIGVVGIQRCAEDALLRSLAVHPDHRSTGVGRRLCERAIAYAGEHALQRIYLLTTDAADYFKRHGFSVIAREATPASIRATAQFAALCPASAVVMARAG